MNKIKYKPGDIVEVLPPNEIMKTLDPQGTLNNMPFMPEMLKYCGVKFKVKHNINKTCVECLNPNNLIVDEMREFIWDDVVLLEDLRCDGKYHGNCKINCMIFWRAEWLRKSIEARTSSYTKKNDENVLLKKLITQHNNGKYFCQSTQLSSATIFISRKKRLLKLIKETLTGRIKFTIAIKSIIKPKLREWKKNRYIKGELTKTPTYSLNLQPGDLVEVKSLSEIIGTLDKNGKNKGLKFYNGMVEYCGEKLKVKNRLDRMINEATGEMMNLENTVILEDAVCDYDYRLYGCPRLRYQIWREIWLKKVNNV